MVGSARTETHDSELVEPVLRVLGEADEPLTLAKIRAALPVGMNLDEAGLDNILEILSVSGRVHRYTPYRSDGPRYWMHAASEYGAQVMLAELRSAALSAAALDKKVAARLADIPPAQRKSILEELVAAGKVHQVPQQPGERAITFRSGPPDLGQYYRGLVTDFAQRARELTNQLTAGGATLELCWTAVDELLDELLFNADAERPRTKSIVAVAGPADPEEPTPEPETAAASLLERVLRHIDEATQTQRRGGLISVRELRQGLGDPEPSKGEFDACILALAQDGKIWLYKHDYAASLSAEEREGLVSDVKGNYYNGVSLRT